MGNEAKVAEGLDFGIITHTADQAVYFPVSDGKDHIPHKRSEPKEKSPYTAEAQYLFRSDKA